MYIKDFCCRKNVMNIVFINYFGQNVFPKAIFEELMLQYFNKTERIIYKEQTLENMNRL